MIYHASIPADDPERVARVIAELRRGTSHPFIAPGTYIVLAHDERGTEPEIGPRGTELIPADGEVGLPEYVIGVDSLSSWNSGLRTNSCWSS